LGSDNSSQETTNEQNKLKKFYGSMPNIDLISSTKKNKNPKLKANIGKKTTATLKMDNGVFFFTRFFLNTIHK
jgi:hypothetical protein